MKLSERLARGAIVMRDTAQMKTQHPEWLIKEMDQSAELLDEAAALARRVEGAGVFRTSEWNGDELGRCDFHPHHVAVELHKTGVKPYTHVALVPVEAPPSTEGG